MGVGASGGRGGCGGCGGAGGCFDPDEESTSTQWLYVGPGRGQFEPVPTYSYVGQGAGSFQKEIVTRPLSHRPKPYCFAALAALTLTAAVVVYTRPAAAASYQKSQAQVAPAREAIQQRPGVAVAAEPIVRPPFFCAAPELAPGAVAVADGAAAAARGPAAAGGPAALVGASIVEAAWGVTDKDHNGTVDQQELDRAGREKRLSTRALRLLRTAAAGARGGLLHRTAFAAVLAKAATLSAPTGGDILDVVSTAAAEAAWVVVGGGDEGAGLGRKELAALLDAARSSGSRRGHAPLTDRERRLLLATGEGGGSGDAFGRAEFRAGLERAGRALFVAASGVRTIISAVVGEVLWIAADADADGRVNRTELKAVKQKHALARDLQHLNVTAEGGGFEHDDFVSRVAQDSMIAKLLKTLATRSASSSAATSWAAGALVPMAAWSSTKRTWCCKHVGLGCARTPAPAPYNCEVGPVNREESWTPAQTRWCCRHGGLVCVKAPPTPPVFPASAPTSPPPTRNAPGRRSLPPAPGGSARWPATAPLYDCAAGYAAWERSWSDGKKDWCCRHSRRGCPASLASSVRL